MGLGTVPICDSRRFRELSLSLRGVQDSFHVRRRAPLDVLRDACTVLAAVNVPVGIGTFGVDDAVRGVRAGASLVAIGHPIFNEADYPEALARFVQEVKSAR